MKNPERPPSLRQQVSRGLAWSLLQTWGSRIITFGVFLVLARLLGPSDFGIVTTAYVIVGAIGAVIDLGMGDALVRQKDAHDGHYDSAFWLILAGSLACWAALALGAGLIGRLFDQPTLPPLLVAVGATLPLTALSAPQEAKLRVALQFKPLALRALGAAIAGGAVGIAFAAAGYGYWALLAKGLVESFAGAVLLWRASPYRPGTRFAWEHWRTLFRVARPLVGSRLIDIVNQRLDSLIVSARLGPTALGFYAAGQRLYLTMMEALFTSVNRVTLPAFAKLQDDPARLRSALLRVGALASFFTFPLFALTGVLAEPLVVLLFGPRWLPAAPVLSAFCIAGLLFSVSWFNAPLMVACGRTQYVLTLTIVNTATNAAGFLIGVHWGALGVALAYSIRGYLVFPLGLVLLKRTIDLPIHRYLANLVPPLIVALGVAGAVWALRRTPSLGVDGPLAALALAAGAILAYAAAMVLAFPARCEAVAEEIELLLPRAAKLTAWMHRGRGRR